MRPLVSLAAAAAIGLGALAAPAHAAPQDAETAARAQRQADLLEKYQAKVSEAWFVDNGFTDDFDLARERARDARTPIFVYFTRSYAP